jgi:RNA polymerase sigma-70 factor (ECF subfamily)
VNTTSASLLDRLRLPGEQDAWPRFVKLYTPLLFFWARRLGLNEDDARDLVQDVFTVLVQKLPVFRYDAPKGFRNWLKTVLLNKWRDRNRRRSPVSVGGDRLALSELAAAEEPDVLGETEYRQLLIARALQLMQAEFPEKMWRAAWEYIVVGRPAAEVATELGIAPGTVYVAKARILCRLREELKGILE